MKRSRVLVVVMSAFLASCATATPSPRPTPGSTPAEIVSPTASTAVTAFVPTYADTACPDAIEVTALVDHACGRLTVLEDRSKPAGRTISLLVVRTPTTVADPRSWPGTGFGGDLGMSSTGVTPEGATRTKATQYGLVSRGLQHSDPELTCPEVDGLDVAAAEAGSSDEPFQRRFVEAVSACRARLTGAGVDVAAYDVTHAAADLEDLRVVLGLDDWLIDTKGDASLYTFAYLRNWAAHVGRVVLDSPRFPQDQDPRLASTSLDYAWRQFVGACSADPACNHLLPDPTGTLRTTVDRLDAHPISFGATTGRVAEHAGRPVSIRVDGEKLLRLVRSVLGGDGPGHLAGLPSILAAAANGEADPLAQQVLGNDPTACLGRRPECANPGAFVWGVYLSVMCRDVVPFDQATATASGPDGSVFDRIATDKLLIAACQAWDVPPADAGISQPASFGTPMLIYTGQFDSWSSRPQVEAALPSLSGAHYFEVPGQTHNVMGFTDCSISMRNAWLDDASKPPPDTSCLSGLHATFGSGPSGG